VERKKVEAITVGELVLMSGGEIGHHPPVPAPAPEAAESAPLVAHTHGKQHRVKGYSSSVDIYDSKAGAMVSPPAELSLARQYFGVAAAGGKAFFGGGFANDPSISVQADRKPGYVPQSPYRCVIGDPH
jgi:hypothetical protein